MRFSYYYYYFLVFQHLVSDPDIISVIYLHRSLLGSKVEFSGC